MRLLALLVVFAAAVSFAQPVRVTRRVNTNPRDTSFSGGGAVLGGALYFVANTDAVGWELFRSDGNAAGTGLVVDLDPGARSSYPNNLQVFDGKLLFTTTGAIWQSNGTAAGTTRLAALPCDALLPLGTTVLCGSSAWLWAIAPDGQATRLLSGTIERLVELGGVVYFGAQSKLWKTDGTVAGTVSVSNTPVSRLARVGARLYFVSTDSTHGTEVWTSDGTTAGTALVADTTGGVSIDYLSAGTSHFYFRANNRAELWATDGVTTTRVATGLFNAREALAGDTLFFPGPDGELWKTDGTIAGTSLVKELVVGTSHPQLESLSPLSATRIVFSAAVASARNIYVSDGSAAGTTLIAPESQVEFAQSWTAMPGRLGNTLLFGGTTVSGDELWKTDGTVAGTSFVKDLSPGNHGGTTPSDFFNLAGALYFRGAAATGTSLFRSEGTAATTTPRFPFTGASPVTFGTSAWYLGTDAAAGAEPWITDGTAAGTRRFADLVPGTASSTPFTFARTTSRLFFLALKPPLSGPQLWVTDGTVAGTQALTSLTTDANNLFLTTDGDVVFLAVGGGAQLASRQLWRSDGTLAGTTLVHDFGLELFEPIQVLGGEVRLTTYGTTAGRREWRSDGTPAGTRLDLVAPANVVQRLFAGGRDFALVRNTQATSSDFFDDTIELWATDVPRTAWALVKRLGAWYPTAGERLAHHDFNGRLLFAFDDGVSGREPWVSDGTAAGTGLLRELAPGGQSGLAFERPFFAAGGEVWFAGSDGVSGCELWRSDLTATGTRSAGDLVVGPEGACPVTFTVEEPHLYFSGSDEGRAELFALSLGLDSTPPLITGTLTGTRGNGAWFTSNVTVHFEVVDQESAITSRTGCDDVTVTEDTRGQTFTCSATSSGGTATASVTLARDATPPLVTCPAPQTVEASGPTGAVVTFTAPTAADAFTASPNVTVNLASGQTFPLGPTTVMAEARDEAGNRGACSTLIEVKDTRAPMVTCPPSQVLSATSAQGAALPALMVEARDEVDAAPRLTWSSGPGAPLAAGTHTVTVEARDGSDNVGRCSFEVEVTAFVAPIGPEPQQPVGCGCASVDFHALLAALAVLLARRR